MYQQPGIGYCAGLFKAFAVSLLFFSCQSSGFAQENEKEETPAPSVDPVATFSSELIHYRKMALKHQTLLHALRASVEAAQVKSRAVDALPVPTVIRRDLRARRQQAEKGILVAKSRLRQAEWETMYAVTRMYLSAIFARAQQTEATSILEDENRLPRLKKAVDEVLKNDVDRPDVREWHKDWLLTLEDIVKGRREEAVVGVERALAGLREAIGLHPSVKLQLPSAVTLPDIAVTPQRELIVKWALERRGELLQAKLAADVVALEIAAQQATPGLSGDTFAKGSDLHSVSVPQGERGENYRPAAIGIEMPSILVGGHKIRAEQASALYDRAKAVVEKARQLIALQAEDAYYKWQEASVKAERYEAAAKRAEKTLEKITKLFVPFSEAEDRVLYQDFLNAANRRTELRLQANEAKFKLLLALAELERVTAGGFCAGFETLGTVQTVAPESSEVIPMKPEQ